MQFLAIVRRRTEAFADSEFSKILDDEAEAASRLYEKGLVRAIWGRADVPGAVLLIEAEDVQSTENALSSLPFVAKNMLEVSIVPLTPYRGFGPLRRSSQ